MGTNYEIAETIDNLNDDDFYEVMMELGDMHDCDTVDDFVYWLKNVLHEIENNYEDEMINEKYTLMDMPVIGDTYYSVAWDTDYSGDIISDLDVVEETFTADSFDVKHIDSGMAFKTAEAAEREKYNVYKRLTRKDWENV